jgi:hypothetical protein
MSRSGKCGLWFALPFMLAVLVLGATSTQPQVSEYLSVATSKIGNSDFERSQHRPFKSDAATALAFGNLLFIELSYINFDRKQNTRLWPFIFTGITRSPPTFS